MRPRLALAWSTMALVAATLPASETNTSGQSRLGGFHRALAGAGNDHRRALGLKELGGLRADYASASADESDSHEGLTGNGLLVPEMFDAPLAPAMARVVDGSAGEIIQKGGTSNGFGSKAIERIVSLNSLGKERSERVCQFDLPLQESNPLGGLGTREVGLEKLLLIGLDGETPEIAAKCSP
jgi:hypothetical protein